MTTTLADKVALLAKMERDRQALAVPMRRSAPRSTVGAAWARTAALAAGATLGWPRFLRQPLRAMAAVAMRDRVSELMGRMQVRRVSNPMPDPDMARLEKMVEAVRAAAERSADDAEIERLRAQLDDQVRRLRTARALLAAQTSRPMRPSDPSRQPAPARPPDPSLPSGSLAAPTGRDVSAIP
ncbi:MAG: hypothetical protein ACN6O5_13350 [Achromobacter sp.]|uniref:hypothetical protein n=1 Tax=unclassified Achromobacter TaxID=2626865 RepID=UPI0006FB5297|nr:hypothetical protein [Achromobacter sp. Root565]KRA02689.1 hypothetical protein ASD71_11955 [Achromobacter sp. Root565]